jgi:hypothetical protein
MLRGEETYWICMNRDCGAAVACDKADRGLKTRVCRCGQWMRKEAHPVVFSYLNFLREEASGETEEMKEKEETPCER